MTAKDILKKPYRRVIVAAEEGGYVAIIEEFPGCITQGDGLVETVKRLEEAAELWIEASLAHEVKIPEPLGLPSWKDNQEALAQAWDDGAMHAALSFKKPAGHVETIRANNPYRKPPQ
jgi:predicted RNase H-like HicB family nuclease